MTDMATSPRGALASAIHFAEQLGAMRALTPAESDALAHCVSMSMRITRRWTKEEDSLLIAFKRANMTDSEIARSMGRTYHATKSRLRDLRKGRV